jgi:hypothetical protein
MQHGLYLFDREKSSVLAEAILTPLGVLPRRIGGSHNF